METHISQHATEFIILLFLIIVFLQSGLDKILDWKGNLSWLNSHFSKTIFARSVGLLLLIVTIMEVLTGLLALIALYYLVLEGDTGFAFYPAFTACTTLLMLLFGQRSAKDYEGAKTIVIYLIISSFLLFIVQ